MKKTTKVLVSSIILLPTATIGLVSACVEPSLEANLTTEADITIPTVSEINVEKINHNSMLVTTNYNEVLNMRTEGTVSLYDASNAPKGEQQLEMGKEYLFLNLERGMEYTIKVNIDYKDPLIPNVEISENATTELTYNWYNRMNENVYEEIESVFIPTEFWHNDYQNHTHNAWDDSPNSDLTLEHFFGQLAETQNISSEAFLTSEGKSTGNIDTDKLDEIIVEFQIPKFTTYELPMRPLENDIWFHNRAAKYGIVLETSGTHYDSVSQENTDWEHTISFGDKSASGVARGEWMMKPIHPWINDEEKIMTNSTDNWMWELNSINNPEYYDVDFSSITKTLKENITNKDENGDFKLVPTDSFITDNDGWFASILLKGFVIPDFFPDGNNPSGGHDLIYNPMANLFSIIPLKRVEVPLKDEAGEESTFIIEPFGNEDYKTTFETTFMSWKVSGDELDQISYRQFVTEDTGELDNSRNKVIGDITLLPDNAAEIDVNDYDRAVGIFFITWASITSFFLLSWVGYKKYLSYELKNNSKENLLEEKQETNDK